MLNSATDTLILNLISYDYRGIVKNIDIIRLYAFQHSAPVDPKIKNLYTFTKETEDGLLYDIPEKKVLLQKNIIFTTVNFCAQLHGIGIPPGHFTHIIIDEAAQAYEPEI